MKKITLLTLTLMSGYFSQAQISFEAVTDFGKLMDVTYDASIQNKIYAATQGNHIVVSNDNGQNWSVLYSSPESDFLSDLRLAPGNNALTFSTRTAIHIFSLLTNTITASFPVPENGVDGAGPSYVSSYSLFDAAGNTMILDTGFPLGFSTQGKTFYTKNAGVTWTEIYYTANNDNVFINNVAISPTDSKKVFLARGNGDSDIDGGLWISSNEGSTFTESLPGVTFDPIAFRPGNSNDIVIGTGIGFGIHDENIFRSTNGGLTWTAQNITWTNETLNNITTIKFNPANTDEIIALEENEIVRTTDNGQSWTNIVYPVGIAMDYYYGINASFNPANSNQIAITTDFYPQFFNKTEATLTQIKVPFYNIISTAVGKYPSGTELYYGAQGGRFHKNISSGESSYTDTESPNSFNPKRNYIIADPVVAGRVFTYASMGFFGGNLNIKTHYNTTTTNTPQSFSDDIQELAVDPNNNNIIYVSMRSGEGGTVTKINFSDLENIVTTDIITPEVSEMGEGVVTGIVVSGSDSNTIYITKKTSFFKSVDGGINWTLSNSGLEGISENTDLIWDMQKNPLHPHQLTLSSNVGIYTSLNSGDTWELLLPGRDVRRIKHSTLNPKVIVGTIFSNMFENASIVYTVDNGENWTAISSEMLDYVQSYGMDYDFDGTTIKAYIATSDLGVVKYEIEDALLAVNKPAASNSIGMYPNPAVSQITLLTDENVQSVQVFSLGGQQVLKSNLKTIDVSALSKGIYFVKLTTVSGKHFIQKLIKE